MFDVATLGEALVLLAATEPGPLSQVRHFSKHTAGAETNVAVGLARMRLRVAWLSRLGNDAGGQFLRQAFEAEGIDCARVPLVDGARTAFMFKSRSDDGSDPAIEYHRQGSAASQLGPDDIDRAWLVQARHLHASGVFAALNPRTFDAVRHAMQTMRDAGKTVSFDPNLRPTLWPSEGAMRDGIHALCALAHWVMPGLQEGQRLTGRQTPQDIAAFYRELGAACVVVKCGAQGAYYASDDATGWLDALPVARVVDTVGAGDAFAVGLISALLNDRPLPAAVKRAHWMGACAVQARGDSDGLPTYEQWQAAGVD
jgi:dehydrogluconokinase